MPLFDVNSLTLRRLAWSAALLLGCATAASAAPRVIAYPRSESDRDDRPAYPLTVLRLALDKAGSAYELVPSAAAMQQSRGLALLEAGRGIDVAWTVTTQARERALRPVRFPIDRGLIGWRLLLIRRGEEARFADLATPADLAALRGVQGHDWPDLDLLRANGLRVDASPTYDGLFRMLARGHADYLPRSISEAIGELQARSEMPIALEPALVLHYPSALYFFVRPGDSELAGAIERGLEASLRDGSLQAEFDRHFAGAIARAALPTRRVIELRNPLLSPETPLARRELWFAPDAGRE